LPLFFNFALEYSIRNVHESQMGLILNGTLQLLAYAYDVNVLLGKIETLTDASRDVGVEIK
jgi:hypothetical protein